MSEAKSKGIPVWCLSNDVGRWSDKIRNNLGIEEFLRGSVISGDIGIRKPDKGIYKTLIQSSGFKIEEILFVDDREKNVVAARELGIETIMFEPEFGFSDVKKWISQRGL